MAEAETRDSDKIYPQRCIKSNLETRVLGDFVRKVQSWVLFLLPLLLLVLRPESRSEKSFIITWIPDRWDERTSDLLYTSRILKPPNCKGNGMVSWDGGYHNETRALTFDLPVFLKQVMKKKNNNNNYINKTKTTTTKTWKLDLYYLILNIQAASKSYNCIVYTRCCFCICKMLHLFLKPLHYMVFPDLNLLEACHTKAM